MNRRILLVGSALLLIGAAAAVSAHHSHALFDLTKTLQVSGTAAKLEWSNPHIFLWMYVPDKSQPSGSRLYAFESGALVAMARVGWDRNAITPGEKVSVDYMPLRDGRPGGVLLKLTRADGRVLSGDPLILQASKAQQQVAK